MEEAVDVDMDMFDDIDDAKLMVRGSASGRQVSACVMFAGTAREFCLPNAGVNLFV